MELVPKKEVITTSSEFQRFKYQSSFRIPGILPFPFPSKHPADTRQRCPERLGTSLFGISSYLEVFHRKKNTDCVYY